MTDRNATEIQENAVRIKYDKKIELEKIRHQNIMEEIDALKKAKITKFSRFTGVEGKEHD